MIAPIDNSRKIELSSQQKACVDFTADSDLLVKGIAGSGKTTVIVARAIRLMRDKAPSDSQGLPLARIFTYNRSLAEYVRVIAQQLGEDAVPSVSSFHTWASEVLRKVKAGHRQTIDSRLRQSIINQAVREVSSERNDAIHQAGPEFWEDEIDWMKGRGLISEEQYLATDRVGRGGSIRLRREDRTFVFAVYQRYEYLLQQRRLSDWQDYALRVLQHRTSIPPNLRAVHVLIDEGQDLQPAQIMAIRSSATRSITIAADKVQNIYPTRFRWADIGIDVVGKSKSLTKSYRTTKAIADLAQCLHRSDLALSEDGGEISLEYKSSGGIKPLLIARPTSVFLVTALKAAIRRLRESSPEVENPVIGVLHRFRIQLDTLAPNLGEPVRILSDGGTDFVSPGIVMSTIHSAKGLEFDHVVVLGVEDGVLPSTRYDGEDTSDPDDRVKIARRLLYVAMTRARFGLALITDSKKSCPFIKDLDRNLYTEIRL